MSKKIKTLVETDAVPYVNQLTGDVVMAKAITKEVPMRQFWKVYLTDFLEVLGVIQSKQIEVFIYVCENMQPSTNLFIGTYRSIHEATGISEPTIATVMKLLQENKFIEKKQNGVWFVNPNIIMKGNEHKQAILLSYFDSDVKMTKSTIQTMKMRIEGGEIVDVENEPIYTLDEDGMAYPNNLLEV